MNHRLHLPVVTDRRLRGVILIAVVIVVGMLLWYAANYAVKDQEVGERTGERDAARGAAEQVIDCVQDPDTESTQQCEQEAQEAQETLEEEVPPANLTRSQRREVVLIAARLIAAQPELSADEVADDVIEQLPVVEDGERGPRGRPGVPGESPSTEEVRALVDAFLEANPPPSGDDGTDGADGTSGTDGRDGKDATPEMVDAAVARYCAARNECIRTGPEGAQGPSGETGATGPQGPAGPTCPDGYAGRELDVLTPADGPLSQPVVVTIFACVPVPAAGE